jgi:NhaP-type Na+/H+ or K+/H+ antiporter
MHQVLKIEAGTNDIVVLPVVLVLIAVIRAEDRGITEWVAFMAQLLLLGPAIGFAVGGVGSWLINKADSWIRIRREHQALYGIGLVLAAYVAATVAGGDGFLSAFAAGLAVTLLNQSLCDYFLEYGEVTSEMAMLLTFVLFGAVLSGILDTINLPPALALAGLVIFAIRPSALELVLARARMS